MQQSLKLDEGSQQLLLDDHVSLLALDHIGRYLRAEAIVQTLDVFDDFAQPVLGCVESTHACAAGHVAGETLSSLFQVAH